MGRIDYAIVSLPASPYASDLRETLGCAFDVGVNLCGCTGDQVAHALVASGLAEQFEKMNPVFVAGKSSYDLLRIMLPLLPCESVPAPVLRCDRSPEFWVGWMVALYQIQMGVAYRTIFSTASFEELRGMYWPLHEAPESKFIKVFDELVEARSGVTRLRSLREAAGLSQSQLAEKSGVGLRSIQMYEQRRKDIDKAQAATLYRLSCALSCSMELLLER